MELRSLFLLMTSSEKEPWLGHGKVMSDVDNFPQLEPPLTCPVELWYIWRTWRLCSDNICIPSFFGTRAVKILPFQRRRRANSIDFPVSKLEFSKHGAILPRGLSPFCTRLIKYVKIEMGRAHFLFGVRSRIIFYFMNNIPANSIKN